MGMPKLEGLTIKKVWWSDDQRDPHEPEIDAILFTDNSVLILYANDEIDRDEITVYLQPPCDSCGCQARSLEREDDPCLCGAGR